MAPWLDTPRERFHTRLGVKLAPFMKRQTSLWPSGLRLQWKAWGHYGRGCLSASRVWLKEHRGAADTVSGEP